MKKDILRKRIGNDIYVRWSVHYPDGSPVDFAAATSRSLHLKHKTVNFRHNLSDCDYDGNLLSFHFPAGKQIYPGRYDLELEFTKHDPSLPDKTATFTIDHCDVFEIVEKSCQLLAPGEDPVLIEGIVTALSYSMLSDAEKTDLAARLASNFTIDQEIIEGAQQAGREATASALLATSAAASAEAAALLSTTAAGKAEGSAEIADEKGIYAKEQGDYAKFVAMSVDERVAAVELAQPNKYAASWITDDLNPDSDNQIGDLSVADCWRPYLIDCSKNNPDDINVIGELMRNNFLRFIDGSFAPTVGITEEMRAECDQDLYLDSDAYELHAPAGQFNSAAFYSEYGMHQKLYDINGNQVRVLRPWETTSRDHMIVLAQRNDIWIIDNVTGRSGKTWKAIFNRPTMWDGIEAKKLHRTGFTPGPATTVDGKMRTFFFLYNPGDPNTSGYPGSGSISQMFVNPHRCYPRHSLSQLTTNTYARANNSNPDISLPFSEGGMFTYCAFLASMEIKHRTKYLHNPSLFGSGISSNEVCTNEDQFLNSGGVRYSLDAGDTWSYSRWNGSNELYYNSTGSRTNMNAFLAGESTKEQCLESQMAASFAAEMGIPENADFEMYGSIYRYANVPGANGLFDGEMNAKIYKLMRDNIVAYDAAGAELPALVECNLRVSLVNGFNLCGDLFRYVGGGCESIGLTADPVSDSTYKVYLETDQEKFINDPVVTKDDFGVFDAESQYELVGEDYRCFNGYRKSMAPYTITGGEQGGGLSTGECAYIYGNNNWSSVPNRRVRVGLRAGGYANNTNCAARNVNSNNSAASSNRTNSGFAQVRLRSVGATP